jgi:molecular chaperone Hsp33
LKKTLIMRKAKITMKTDDHYLRAITSSGGIRILVCSVPVLAGEIIRLQGASPTVSVALGRGLAAGALMGALLKPGQRVALKFEGNGPMQKMIIEADNDGAVRGTVANPSAEAPPVNGRWNIPEVLGRAGFLTVSRDLGIGGEPYHGTVQLRNSEIGEDLAYYLTDSEQTPTAVGVSVRLASDGSVASCGGFLAQALPRADESEIAALLERIDSLPPITQLLDEGGTDLLLSALMGEIPYNRLESRPLFFRCGCTREKVERALHSLGKEGVRDLIERDGFAEVKCEFCKALYRFDVDELKRLEALSLASNP